VVDLFSNFSYTKIFYLISNMKFAHDDKRYKFKDPENDDFSMPQVLQGAQQPQVLFSDISADLLLMCGKCAQNCAV